MPLILATTKRTADTELNTATTAPAPDHRPGRKRLSVSPIERGEKTGTAVFNGFQGPAYPRCLPPDLSD